MNDGYYCIKQDGGGTTDEGAGGGINHGHGDGISPDWDVISNGFAA